MTHILKQRETTLTCIIASKYLLSSTFLRLRRQTVVALEIILLSYYHYYYYYYYIIVILRHRTPHSRLLSPRESGFNFC